MNIDALEAFVRVVHEQSFSRAAKSLHITQPAISKRIQALEARLKCTLFERINRKISLTEAGHTLLPYAKSILHEYDNALAAIHQNPTQAVGSLSIIASHHIGLHRLPKFLKQFTSDHPEVDIQLNFLDSESAFSLLRDNMADIAFITLPNQLDEDFEAHVVWPDPMNFICSHDHELAQNTPVDAEELCQHNAILPSQSTITYHIVSELFHQRGLHLKATIPTNYLETMKMMAAVGMGWSLLPKTMIDEEVRVLDVATDHIERQLGALTYRKKRLSHAGQLFLAYAKDAWPTKKVLI